MFFCAFENFEVRFLDHENFEHDDAPPGGVREEETRRTAERYHRVAPIALESLPDQQESA